MDAHVQPATGATNSLLAIGEELGHLDAEHVRTINGVLQEMRASGVKVPVGQLLLERKYITPFQLKEMRQAMVRRVAAHVQNAEAAAPIMRFGNYDILEMISDKERSRVYRARDTRMNRIVALKMLPGDSLNDGQWSLRFQREIEVTGKLIHPNIAAGYGCGSVDGRPFLVTEFVSGLSLSDKLEREGNLPERTAWRIAREIVKALAFANGMGVLHRDIKPDNIILADSGEIKLIDLGLAKLKTSSNSGDLTMQGSTVGSPLYISPEQARGESDLDIRTDLYSLGCTVFQMLTGATPFYSENFLEVMRMQATAERPDPRHILPEISHHSARLVMKMMALERDQRLMPDALLAEINEVLEKCPEPLGMRPSIEVKETDDATAEQEARDDFAPPRPVTVDKNNPPPASVLEAALELKLLREEQAQLVRHVKDKLDQVGIEMPLGPALLGLGFLKPQQLDKVCALLRERGYSRRPVTVLPPSNLKINNYELIRELAAGKESRVYHARDLVMRREVALRIVTGSNDLARVERFNREVQLLARLIHPNIAAAYGAGECQGVPYMATEFVDGISLAERLELQSRLSERTSWRIAREVAKGLAYGASNGVLHRDIKPANVLCSYDGQIKIIDYGLSKSRDDSDGLTVQGTTVGTPYYMAPEQARGTNMVDCRSDIYALGCAVYQMLTGALPFFREEFYEVMEAHTRAPRPDARKLRPDLTPDTAQLVQRMMAIEVDARPESAEALLMEINALLEILPDETMFGSVQPPAGMGPRRYKADTSSVIPALGDLPVPLPAVDHPAPRKSAQVTVMTHSSTPVFKPTPKTSAFRKSNLHSKPTRGFWGWFKNWLRS